MPLQEDVGGSKVLDSGPEMSVGTAMVLLMRISSSLSIDNLTMLGLSSPAQARLCSLAQQMNSLIVAPLFRNNII